MQAEKVLLGIEIKVALFRRIRINTISVIVLVAVNLGAEINQSSNGKDDSQMQMHY